MHSTEFFQLVIILMNPSLSTNTTRQPAQHLAAQQARHPSAGEPLPTRSEPTPAQIGQSTINPTENTNILRLHPTDSSAPRAGSRVAALETPISDERESTSEPLAKKAKITTAFNCGLHHDERYLPRELSPQLQAKLQSLRAERNFQPQAYIAAKTTLINEYFRANNLSGVVIGVSGGIDSAVALALFSEAAKQPNSPLKKIIAAALPAAKTGGASNQDIATDRGQEVAQALKLDKVIIAVDAPFENAKQAVEAGIGIRGNQWSDGQLVSNVRTPMFYQLAALMCQEGFISVVAGTTNLSEGGYLGFFGKVADTAVDVQPISDLFKNEVYQVAEALKVPQSVCEAEPTGDTFDARTDLEMIGAPYDFVELFMHFKNWPESTQNAFLAGLDDEARHQWDTLSLRLVERHGINRHKYFASHMGVHLDVMPATVKGGWSTPGRPAETLSKVPPVTGNPPLVGKFTLPEETLLAVKSCPTPTPEKINIGTLPDTYLVKNVLSPQQCEHLLKALSDQRQVAVGLQGKQVNFSADGLVNSAVGSHRCSTISPELSDVLWEQLRTVLPSHYVANTYSPTDCDTGKVWRGIGVNPIFRFITYEGNDVKADATHNPIDQSTTKGRGSEILPHYDAGFRYPNQPEDNDLHTLMTVVLYLTGDTEGQSLDPSLGGQTRFIHDRERHLPLKERLEHAFKDWDHPAQETEVTASVQPQRGAALIFPHRMLHDVAPFLGDKRVVARTDIVMRRQDGPARMYTPLWQENQSEQLLASKGSAQAATKALHQRLNVSVGASPAQVDAAYKACNDTNDSQLREAWLILRDPYYARLYENTNLEAVYDAGFFDDNATLASIDDNRADPNHFTTSVELVRKNLEKVNQTCITDKKPLPPLAVLVITGAMSPLHRGHLEALNASRKALESKGYAVLGAYVSPDHTKYVKQKTEQYTEAPFRLALSDQLIQQEGMEDWVTVDTWNSQLNENALNFTAVTERLSQYLSHHVDSGSRPIEVFAAFGGDNARLTKAFAFRGGAVCVERDHPSADAAIAAVKADPVIQNNPRILFANATNTDTSINSADHTDEPTHPTEISPKSFSSSKFRAGELPSNAASAQAPHLQQQTEKLGQPKAITLFMRDEGNWAVADWQKLQPLSAEQIAQSTRKHYSAVKDSIQTAFANADPRERIVNFQVETVNAEVQKEQVLAQAEGKPRIALDALIPATPNTADHDLSVSRHYGLGAHANKEHKIANTPGTRSIETQLRDIPAGEYVLTDDDTKTGGTLRQLKSVIRELRPDIQIAKEIVALQAQPDRINAQGVKVIEDINDYRDFLVGAQGSGLVVNLPNGQPARAPYVLPYVSPHSRSSIPISQEVAFSKKIWALNKSFFESATNEPLQVTDMSKDFQSLAQYFGFKPETSMVDVCQWHMNLMDLYSDDFASNVNAQPTTQQR